MENYLPIIFDTLQAHLPVVLKVLLILAVGFPVLFFVRKWIRVFISEHYTPHYGLLVSKIVYYIGVAIVVISMLHELGFSLGPLLGAAGIIGVAIGFASQTSVSNIISGFFLIAEKPFEVNDIISINGNVGVVLSIDTLSVKLRLFDNRYLRVPNEMMLKNEVINVTRFPIRRVEFKVSVAYKEDLARVRDILIDVANKNPIALQEPAPLLIFDGFGSSSIDFQFNVWAVRAEFLQLRNSLYFDIKKRFDDEGIEIPFPHLSLYKGAATEPIPFRMVSEDNPIPETGKPERE